MSYILFPQTAHELHSLLLPQDMCHFSQGGAVMCHVIYFWGIVVDSDESITFRSDLRGYFQKDVESWLPIQNK